MTKSLLDAYEATEVRTCVVCEQPITLDGRQIYEGRARRRSQGKRTSGMCVDCAFVINGRRHQSQPVAPRYCTCYGTVRRTPHLREQCVDCSRRIDPRYDGVPGDVLTIDLGLEGT